MPIHWGLQYKKRRLTASRSPPYNNTVVSKSTDYQNNSTNNISKINIKETESKDNNTNSFDITNTLMSNKIQQQIKVSDAKEVNLQLRPNTTVSDNSNIPDSITVTNTQLYRYGIKGTFVISKDSLNPGNIIRIASLKQESNTNFYSEMNFEYLPDVSVNGINIGRLQCNSQVGIGDSDKQRWLYLRLNDNVKNLSQTDLIVTLNVPHALNINYLSDLYPLSQRTDKTSHNYFFIDNGTSISKKINATFKLTAKVYDADHATAASYFDPNKNKLNMGQRSSFHAAQMYIDNQYSLTREEVDKFVNSLGQEYKYNGTAKIEPIALNISSNVSALSIADTDKYIYFETPKIPMYGSDGKLKNVLVGNQTILPYKTPIKKVANNQTIKQLLATQFNGLLFSNQDDGSLNIVVRLNPQDFKLTDSNIGLSANASNFSNIAWSLLHRNEFILSDPNPELAVRNTLKHLTDNNNILPIGSPRFMVQWLSPEKYGITTTKYFDENGIFIQQQVKADEQAAFAAEGQTSTTIHYINGLTGKAILPDAQTYGWGENNKLGHEESTYTLSDKDTPLVPGYTYRKDTNNKKLNGNTSIIPNDYKVLIKGNNETLKYPNQGNSNYTYILDPDSQKITITYIDTTTGKQLETKTLVGFSNENAGYNTQNTINKYLAAGYQLNSDDTNGKDLIFDQNDKYDQVYTVKLTHKYSSKENDSSTGHRTIIIHDPHTGDRTINQSITYTRTADMDEVTHQIKYGNWQRVNNAKYSLVDIPQIAGYISNVNGTNSTKVTETAPDIPNDTVVNVNYVATATKGSVFLIDDDDNGKPIATFNFNGVTDQTVATNAQLPANYHLAEGQNIPTNVKLFADINKNQYKVHIRHNIKNVPDNPGAHKTLTRTITVHDPHSGNHVTVQKAYLARDAQLDVVTNKVTYGNTWYKDNTKPDAFDEFSTPTIEGYTPDKVSVSKVSVNGFTPDNTNVDISYMANPGHQTINYVNGGKTISSQIIPGVTDQIMVVKIMCGVL